MPTFSAHSLLYSFHIFIFPLFLPPPLHHILSYFPFFRFFSLPIQIPVWTEYSRSIKANKTMCSCSPLDIWRNTHSLNCNEICEIRRYAGHRGVPKLQISYINKQGSLIYIVIVFASYKFIHREKININTSERLVCRFEFTKG